MREIEAMHFAFFFLPIVSFVFLFKYFAAAERFTQGRINGILYAVIWSALAILSGVASNIADNAEADINWVLVLIAWLLIWGVFALIAFTQKQYNSALEAERSFAQAANPLPPGSPTPGYLSPPGIPPSNQPSPGYPPPPGIPPGNQPPPGYPPPPGIPPGNRPPPAYPPLQGVPPGNNPPPPHNPVRR